MRCAIIAFMVVILLTPLGADAAGRKPRLDLRATPRMAFSPTVVMLTAELQGGEEVEEYYCPEVLWEWDDGSRSTHGADCPAYQPGVELERRFTAQHAFRQAGVYTVKVTLLRSGRPLTKATVTVNVRPGAGDFSGDGDIGF